MWVYMGVLMLVYEYKFEVGGMVGWLVGLVGFVAILLYVDCFDLVLFGWCGRVVGRLVEYG